MLSFEDIAELVSGCDGDVRLTTAKTTRTILAVSFTCLMKFQPHYIKGPAHF